MVKVHIGYRFQKWACAGGTPFPIGNGVSPETAPFFYALSLVERFPAVPPTYRLKEKRVGRRSGSLFEKQSETPTCRCGPLLSHAGSGGRRHSHDQLSEARSKFASFSVARHTPHVTGLESPAGGTTNAHSRKRTYIGTFLKYSTTYSVDTTDATSYGSTIGGGTRSDGVVVQARERLNHDILYVPAGGFHQHCCGCCAFATGCTVETIGNQLLRHPRLIPRDPCPFCTLF